MTGELELEWGQVYFSNLSYAGSVKLLCLKKDENEY